MAVTIGLLLGFVTQALHGVHPARISVTALAILGAARVVTVNTLKTVNWSFALLFGVLASMSTVFSETNVDLWIADMAAGAMGDFADQPVVFLTIFTLFCMAISFVLRWQAAAPLLTIALAPVAGAAGIHPIIIGIVAVVACSGFFMPYQSTIYLALYHGTEEKLFSHAQARPLAIAFGVMTLLAVIASVPYWRFLGLL